MSSPTGGSGYGSAEASAPLTKTLGEEQTGTILTKEELEEFIDKKKKEFCKLTCAQCGSKATKQYKDTMTMVIKPMIPSFWCQDCGRVLCGTHRHQHKCERVDAEKAARKNMTAEEMRRRMEEEANRKIAAEEAAKDEERAAAEIAERGRLERKGRRKLIAGKAQHVSGFLQQVSRDPDGARVRGQAAQNELLELYQKASRIALTLYNEFEEPTLPGLAEDDWADLKEIYARARELTHMVVTVEGQPLEMRNPWDPPEAPPMQ